MHPGDFAAVAYMIPAAALLLAALIGWGRLVRRILPSETAPSWIGDSWTGWAAGTIFLQIWHLLLPVDWLATAVMCAIGLAGLRHGRNPERPRPDRPTPGNLAVAGLGLVVFAFMVRQIRSDLQLYDAGMYYYQSIRWLNEHPVVPGVGNLNMQLAINVSYFLWAALLNLHPLWRNGFMVMNALFVVLAMAPGLRVLTRLGPRAPSATAMDVLNVLMIPVAAVYAMNPGAVNPSPDFFAWIAGIAVFSRTAEWLSDPQPSPRPPWHALLMCVALVTVKLNMLILSASMSLLLALMYGIRHTRGGKSWTGLLRPIGVAAVIATLGGVPWMARNIVTSGYPLFPSPMAPASVEWRIPESKMRFVDQFIRIWARHLDNSDMRGQMNHFGHLILNSSPDAPTTESFVEWAAPKPWFSSWIVHTFSQPANIQWLIALALLIPIGAAASRGASNMAGIRSWPLLYIPLAASLAFWFFTAPDIRFGYPLPHLLLALAGALALHRRPADASFQRQCAAILALILAVLAVADAFPRRSKLWKTMASRPRIVMNTRTFVTRSGLAIHIPVADSRCFDTDLPTSSFENPFLSLRNPARGLRGGFKDEWTADAAAMSRPAASAERNVHDPVD